MKRDRRNVACGLILFACALLPCAARGQWVQTNGPADVRCDALVFTNTNLFVGTNVGIFRTTDDGANWAAAGLADTYIHALAARGTNLFAGTDYGIFRSMDSGAHWTQVNNGLANQQISVYAFAINDSCLFAGTAGDGVFRSTDNGDTWFHMGNGILSYVYSLLPVGTNLFAGTDEGVFRSTDNGANWFSLNNGMPITSVFAFTDSGVNLFAGTDSGVFLSTDYGENWKYANNGLSNLSVQSLAIYEGDIFASMYNEGTNGPAGYGIFSSKNNGMVWSQEKNNGLPENTLVYGFAAGNGKFFAGTVDGVFRFQDNGAYWMPINKGLPGPNVRAFTINGANMFLGTDDVGVFHSTNNGETWTPTNDRDSIQYDFSLASLDTNIFAGTNGGVYRSTNNGSSWESVNNGLYGYTFVFTLAVNGQNLFAGTTAKGDIFLSTNNGSTWKPVNNGLPNDFSILSLIADSAYLFAGMVHYGIYISTNNGEDWIQTNNELASTTVYTITADGANLFAGTDSGAFISSNNGANWKSVNNGIPLIRIYAFDTSGTSLFAGTDSGVFLSPDNGAHWRQANKGLPQTLRVNALIINDNSLFAGTNYGVWRRPLSEMITGVSAPPAPSQFSLAQNYPNPFSGMTNVEFRIPNEELVTLNVYNALGEKVATLIHGRQSAGAHTAAFDASGLPAGVYFYRLAAGREVRTGTMAKIN